MSKCFLCGKKFKTKDLMKGFKIRHKFGNCKTNVKTIKDKHSDKIYKLCPKCTKAVAFGYSLANESIEIVGVKVKYFDWE